MTNLDDSTTHVRALTEDEIDAVSGAGIIDKILEFVAGYLASKLLDGAGQGASTGDGRDHSGTSLQRPL
jgi:hypothetical protein